jgi:hypothetical protein
MEKLFLNNLEGMYKLGILNEKDSIRVKELIGTVEEKLAKHENSLRNTSRNRSNYFPYLMWGTFGGVIMTVSGGTRGPGVPQLLAEPVPEPYKFSVGLGIMLAPMIIPIFYAFSNEARRLYSKLQIRRCNGKLSELKNSLI